MKSQRLTRLGYDDYWIHVMSGAARDVAGCSPEKYPMANFGLNLWSQVFDTATVAIGHYLLDDVPATEEWARRLVSETERYFFGDWRLHIPGRSADYYAGGGGMWLDVYRMAVGFASALNDEAALKRLSGFPSNKWEQASDWRKEVPYYLLLAEYFSRGVTPAYESQLSAIRGGVSKACRILAETLDSIVKGRTDDVPERFAEYMKYYLRQMKPRREPEFVLAFDGTVFYHLARRLGRPFDVDDVARDHLVIF